jgi:hypothetical protein
MGALGVPLYPGGAIRSIYMYLSRLFMQKLVGLTVFSVLIMGVYHTKPPPYDYLNLYGACLQAPRTPKMK